MAEPEVRTYRTKRKYDTKYVQYNEYGCGVLSLVCTGLLCTAKDDVRTWVNTTRVERAHKYG